MGGKKNLWTDLNTEVALSLDKYLIMECVSQQADAFRFAELYHMLKRMDPDRWRACDVKIMLEWLADMDLIKRKRVKVRSGQTWLFYQPGFDESFLHSRIKYGKDGNGLESRVYLCQGMLEILRYRYASIKERLNRASRKLFYLCTL